MRGGRTHNDGLVRPAADLAVRLGASIAIEYPASGDCRGRSIDLLVRAGTLRIAWEAELRPDRVAGDVAKALSVGATHLFVVTPDPVTTARCSARLGSVYVSPTLVVCVRPLGPSLQRLSALLNGLLFTESSAMNTNTNSPQGDGSAVEEGANARSSPTTSPTPFPTTGCTLDRPEEA